MSGDLGAGGQCGKDPCPQARCPSPEGQPHPWWPQVELRKVSGKFISLPSPPPPSETAHGGQDGGRGEVLVFSSQGQRITQPDKPPEGSGQSRLVYQTWAKPTEENATAGLGRHPTPGLYSVQTSAGPLLLLVPELGLALIMQAYRHEKHPPP